MVVTVVPQAAEDALRLLELKRFSRRVDAKDRRLPLTLRAQVDAARRRSVCRSARTSEPRANARCNGHAAHLGRHVKARFHSGSAAPAARRVCM